MHAVFGGACRAVFRCTVACLISPCVACGPGRQDACLYCYVYSTFSLLKKYGERCLLLTCPKMLSVLVAFVAPWRPRRGQQCDGVRIVVYIMK